MWELVSFATLKSFLGLSDSLLTDYPALGVIKLSVETAIEEFLGRDLESAERTETIYVTGPSNEISLRALPVTAVSSLVVTMFAEDETFEAEGTDYNITGYGVSVSSTLRNAKVVITYTGGLSSVPKHIERAALLQTCYEFLGKDQVGATFTSTEGGSVTRPELDLLKTVKKLLNRFMHPLKTSGRI